MVAQDQKVVSWNPTQDQTQRYFRFQKIDKECQEALVHLLQTQLDTVGISLLSILSTSYTNTQACACKKSHMAEWLRQ